MNGLIIVLFEQKLFLFESERPLLRCQLRAKMSLEEEDDAQVVQIL